MEGSSMNPLLLRRRLMGEVEEKIYLRFTSLQDGSTLSLVKKNSPPSYTFEYSLNGGGFQTYTIGDSISLDTDDYVDFRKSGNAVNSINSNQNNYYYFNATGDLYCNGKFTDLAGWWMGYAGTQIGGNAFIRLLDTSAVKSDLVIPDTVTSIGTDGFAYNGSLNGLLELPPSLATIGQQSFMYTNFSGTLNIPDTVTSLGAYAFSYCQSMTGLSIGSGVTSIPDYCFQNCTALTSISLPNTVTSLGMMAFAYCSALSGTLTLPSNLTSIGFGAFSNCTGLNGALVIPNTVTSIGTGPQAAYGAFRSCGFTSLTLSTNLTTIGARAFESCGQISGNIDIPASVSDIKVSAFRYCNGVSNFIVRATTPPALGTTVFPSKPIYVPYSSDHSIIDAYKAASNWSSYSSMIFELDQNGNIPT